MEPSKLKSPNSLLMHSMYAVSDIGNGPVVLKLYVEEMYDPNKPNTAKRDYKLLDMQNNSSNVTGSRNNVSPSTQTVVINNVADLVAAVKEYDPDFQPKAPSKIVDEDGNPLIVCHGTDANFTVFDLVANIKKPDGNFVYSLQLNENKKIKASTRRGFIKKRLRQEEKDPERELNNTLSAKNLKTKLTNGLTTQRQIKG